VIIDVTKQLLDDARTHDVEIEEFQFDFDCAQKNLPVIARGCLLRPIVHPIRFVMTVLPAWLDEPEFLSLVRETDGYVLQVHSVPISAGERGLVRLKISPGIGRSSRETGNAFFSCAADVSLRRGYAPDGKLLSVGMDSVQPSWPPGTRILEFGADADKIAALVNEWQKVRPQRFRELIWYRVPIATDARNWRWPTLAAVMAGRPPKHQLSVPAGRREPDRSVDRECGRSGRTTALECNCEMERGRVGSLRRTFRLERSIGKWSRRVQLCCAKWGSITARHDPQNRLASVRSTH
jgi:hypothetical protein